MLALTDLPLVSKRLPIDVISLSTYHMRVDIRIYAMTAAPGPAMKIALPEERKRPLASEDKQMGPVAGARSYGLHPENHGESNHVHMAFFERLPQLRLRSIRVNRGSVRWCSPQALLLR
jgi:hypothetical protein